jgi:hypothetical protein
LNPTDTTNPVAQPDPAQSVSDPVAADPIIPATPVGVPVEPVAAEPAVKPAYMDVDAPAEEPVSQPTDVPVEPVVGGQVPPVKPVV